MSNDHLIEGEFKVISGARREPFIQGGGLVRLAAIVLFMLSAHFWWGFAYQWGMQHIHLQLSELLSHR